MSYSILFIRKLNACRTLHFAVRISQMEELSSRLTLALYLSQFSAWRFSIHT
ncbi:unnamed protein product [Linum tenue]|uniref:Uncharacterized protein n=1 Tax=Linum tenue TaxID=586396 RepID=A0AAV0ICP3_9ROSI|nr:unnamed protein product [Linum tenue]